MSGQTSRNSARNWRASFAWPFTFGPRMKQYSSSLCETKFGPFLQLLHRGPKRYLGTFGGVVICPNRPQRPAAPSRRQAMSFGRKSFSRASWRWSLELRRMATLARGWIGGFRGGSRERRLRRCGTFRIGGSACARRYGLRANLL